MRWILSGVLVNWNLSSNGKHTSLTSVHYYQYSTVQHSGWFHIIQLMKGIADIYAPQDSYWYICQLTSMTTATTDVQMENIKGTYDNFVAAAG